MDGEMNEHHPLHLRQDSPLRPPDWRWWRAKLQLSQKGLSKRRNDQWTIAAMQFQRLFEGHQGEVVLEDLAPNMTLAHSIWSAGESPMRCALESRILAGEEFEDIARKTGLGVATIRTYEATFFNVLDCLDAPGWITHQVFGSKFHDGLEESDIGILLRAYGYWRGPVLVDVLLDAWRSNDWSRDVFEAHEMLADDARRTLQIKTVLAMRMQPETVPGLKKLLRLGLRVRAMDAEVASAGVDEAEIEARIAKLMEFQPEAWEGPTAPFQYLLNRDHRSPASGD